MSFHKCLRMVLLACLAVIMVCNCVSVSAYAHEKSYYEITENTSDETYNIILLGGGGDNQVFVNGEAFGPVTENNIRKVIDENRINVLCGHSTGANQIELFIRNNRLDDVIDLYVLMDAQAYVEEERYCLGDTERPLVIFISDQMNRINWYTFKQQYTNYEIYHLKGTTHVNIATDHFDQLVQIIHAYFERHGIDGNTPKEMIPELTRHNKEKIDLTVEYHWDDNSDASGNRPGRILATLYADNEAVERRMIAADENGYWTCTFEGVPKCKKGIEIDYYMEQNNLPECTNNADMKYTVVLEDVWGYYSTSVRTDNTIYIENHYAPETIKLRASNLWKTYIEQMPDVLAQAVSKGIQANAEYLGSHLGDMS